MPDSRAATTGSGDRRVISVNASGKALPTPIPSMTIHSQPVPGATSSPTTPVTRMVVTTTTSGRWSASRAASIGTPRPVGMPISIMTESIRPAVPGE
jgi:hypothetical protein